MAKISDPDMELQLRCANILREKGAPMDAMALSRLLRADSSAVYRACFKIPGVTLAGVGMLQTFTVPPK